MNLLKDRIDSDFFRFGQQIDGLNKRKLIHCSETSPGDIEFHEKLELSDNLKTNTREIVALTKQAIELYRSSKQESL